MWNLINVGKNLQKTLQEIDKELYKDCVTILLEEKLIGSSLEPFGVSCHFFLKITWGSCPIKAQICAKLAMVKFASLRLILDT